MTGATNNYEGDATESCNRVPSVNAGQQSCDDSGCKKHQRHANKDRPIPTERRDVLAVHLHKPLIAALTTEVLRAMRIAVFPLEYVNFKE